MNAGVDPVAVGLAGPHAVAEHWLPRFSHRAAVDMLLGQLPELLDEWKECEAQGGAVVGDGEAAAAAAAEAHEHARHADDVVVQMQQAGEEESLQSLKDWLIAAGGPDQPR